MLLPVRRCVNLLERLVTVQICVYVSPLMPVNWNGRVAIRDLNRRSRGDFQPIDAKSTSWLPSPPRHPPARSSPLQPFPGFSRSDVLAGGRPSLVRYYAHTEQVTLNSEHLRAPFVRPTPTRPRPFLPRDKIVTFAALRSSMRGSEGRPPITNETIVSGDLVHVTIHRGGHRYLDVVDRLRHRLTDKVQLAHLLDACSRVD